MKDSVTENINKYKIINTISYWVGIIFSTVGLITLFIIIIGGKVINSSMQIDIDLGEKSGTFIAGFVGTCFGISGTAIIISTFLNQYIQNLKNQVENIFFKYIDLHYENINQIKIEKFSETNEKATEVTGRLAFVSMESQLYRLLELIKQINNDWPDDFKIDFAYMIFFYGFNKENLIFFKSKHKKIDNIDDYLPKLLNELLKDVKLGRANQTFISSYMRNIYNAIKFIDISKVLDFEEKKDYIRILRSQLSNPELYIIYFNIRSRFGTNWEKNDYIRKYQLFTNIPEGYCQEYDHKKYFSDTNGFQYEDDEYNDFFENIDIKNSHNV